MGAAAAGAGFATTGTTTGTTTGGATFMAGAVLQAGERGTSPRAEAGLAITLPPPLQDAEGYAALTGESGSSSVKEYVSAAALASASRSPPLLLLLLLAFFGGSLMKCTMSGRGASLSWFTCPAKEIAAHGRPPILLNWSPTAGVR